MGGLPSMLIIQDPGIEEFFVAEHVKHLRDYILKDKIDLLDKKLSEISANGNSLIRSVLLSCHEDGNNSQTLLMTAIRKRNLSAFNLLINHPVKLYWHLCLNNSVHTHRPCDSHMQCLLGDIMIMINVNTCTLCTTGPTALTTLLKLHMLQIIVEVIDQRNRYGTTALHTAFDSYYMVKRLLEKGADPNILTIQRASCVGIAIQQFHSQTIDIIKLLLEYNFNIKKYFNEYQTKTYDSTISWICRYGDLECLLFMLEIAKNNNLFDKIDWFHVSNKGYNLIHLATHQNKYQMVEYLLNNIFSDYERFEYNILAMKDASGHTAFHKAAACDYVRIFEQFASYSSGELFTYDNDGLMPIHHACKGGSIQVLKFIVSNKKYSTKRHLNSRVLTKIRGGERATPLVVAIKNGRVECVKMLCFSDNLNILATRRGKTIFDIAIKKGNRKIFDILIRAWHKRHFDSNSTGLVLRWINEIKRKKMHIHNRWQNNLATLESMINVNDGGLIDTSVSTRKHRPHKSGVQQFYSKYQSRWMKNNLVSQIQEPSCLQCKHKLSVADTDVSMCELCEVHLHKTSNSVTYYCSNCKKYICNGCKHKQFLQNILYYYENKKIKVTLAHGLFSDWYEQNKKNVKLMIQLVENQKILDFVCHFHKLGELFEIWCNSNMIDNKNVFDKLVCQATFQRSIDHSDTLLLDLLDKYGFDFKTNIDKKYKMNEWTPFLELCRRAVGGSFVVKFLKKLFKISKKHNAKIDIFAKDESNRTGLENAIMFGTVEVVEYLLGDVYSQSKQDMIRILTNVSIKAPSINRKDTTILFLCDRNSGISGSQLDKSWLRTRRFEIFKILVKYIHMYNLKWFDSYVHRTSGWNIIHCLCANNCVSYLKVLRDTFGNSIDWNVKTDTEWRGTPLMAAMNVDDANFNIECIRFLANIESIDIASYHCGPKCMDLDGNHGVGERAYIVIPQMTSLEYSCYFGRKIEVVRILFQAWIKQLKSRKNDSNDKGETMIDTKLIQRLIELTKEGKDDCIGLKRWKKNYNAENYEKIEVLLGRMKTKLEENSNDYHTISSLVNYLPNDLITNKNSKMVNDYANVDAKWDESYHNMLKSRFNSNSNYEMPKVIQNMLKKLKDSNSEKNEDWYILKHLGRGAFGLVDLAIHETLGKRAALKRVKIKNIDENDKENLHHSTKSTKKQAYVNKERKYSLKNLEMEIGVLSRIQHPNTINLLAYKFKSDNRGDITALLVFEYALMGDLDGFMKKCEYLPEKIAKSLIKFVLNGLKYLHSKNMIHRDIKPHNILLDFQFQPKLSDFGLSRDRNMKQSNVDVNDLNAFSSTKSYNYNTFTLNPASNVINNDNAGWCSRSTWISKAAGTLSYMSLEARQGDVSREGDIFSVGVMLWNIMIGGYGDENFHTAHAPFGFECKIYNCSSRGPVAEYSADELYEKIQEKDYQEYFQLVTEKLEKQEMDYNQLSPSFFQLFVKMIANDKKDRPSIEQIFQYEWMNRKQLLTKFQLRNEMKKLHDAV